MEITEVRNWENYLGNIMSWYDDTEGGFKATFPEMFSYLGDFLHNYKTKYIRYVFHSTVDRNAFNNRGRIIKETVYEIKSNEYDSYISANPIFAQIENLARLMAKADSFDSLVTHNISVSPSNAKLSFGFDYSDGAPATVFQLSNDRYHPVIAQNAQLVAGIVLAAKARAEVTDNFFNNAIWFLG